MHVRVHVHLCVCKYIFRKVSFRLLRFSVPTMSFDEVSQKHNSQQIRRTGRLKFQHKHQVWSTTCSIVWISYWLETQREATPVPNCAERWKKLVFPLCTTPLPLRLRTLPLLRKIFCTPHETKENRCHTWRSGQNGRILPRIEMKVAITCTCTLPTCKIDLCVWDLVFT